MRDVIFEVVKDSFIFNHIIYTEPSKDRSSFKRHFNNDLEILFFIKGSATYVIEDKKYKLNAGDLVIIRPSKYHYIQIDEDIDYERYNLLFPVSFIGKELLRSIPAYTEVINCEHNDLIFDLFKKTDIYSNFGTEAFIDIIPGIMKELFYNLVHCKDDALSTPTTLSSIVTQALEYINKNLYTIEDVEEISQALFVTQAYFFRVFKEQLKISPKKYITNKRLVAAEKLLKKGEKPTAVYQKCGFNTYTAFYKRFVDFFGHPPSNT